MAPATPRPPNGPKAPSSPIRSPPVPTTSWESIYDKEYQTLASRSRATATAAEAIQTGDKIDIDRSSAADSTAGAYGVDRTYGGGSGGSEFLVRKLNPGTGYSTFSNPLQAIKTFCIEESEYIYLGGDYWVSIDNNALKGSLSFGDYTTEGTAHMSAVGAVGSPANGDPVGASTAWLYGTYVSNALNTVSLVGGGTFAYDNDTWANDLQLAIWRLEGELTSDASLTSNAIKLRDVALLPHANSYNVKALNLWTDHKTVGSVEEFWGLAQSQSILVEAVPEPTAWAVWAIFSAYGVIIAIRRRRTTGC